MTKLLKVGDRIFFDDDEHLVVALSGVRVRLEAADGTASVVLVSHLVDSPGFAILGQSDAGFGSGGLAGQSLADVPANATERARDWERHVVEVQTGLPPGADPGATPRPEYDPARTTIRQREAAKPPN